MNNQRNWRWTCFGAAAVAVSIAGCSQNSPPSQSVPRANPTRSTANAARPIPSQVPTTKTQVIAFDLIKALQKNTLLAKADISIGYSPDTVTLDGQVPSAAAKDLALQIARKTAPGYKILNRLTIKTSAPKTSVARKSTAR